MVFLLGENIHTTTTRLRPTRRVVKGLRLLPHPFLASDPEAGYTYDLSIWQAEFALTQILDRPLCGRLFFEASDP